MGDGEPGALTELAGATEADTELAYAWAEDWPEDEPTRRLTPRRITALGLAASLAIIAVAAVVVFQVIVDAKHNATIGHPFLDGEAKSSISGTYIEPPPPPAPVTVTVHSSVPTGFVPRPPEPEPIELTPDFSALDDQFVERLRANNWTVWDPVTMATQAHTACSSLRGGGTPESVIHEMSGPESAYTAAEASSFVIAAMAVYPDCS
jgi:Protein of unknown function (DUF732)